MQNVYTQTSYFFVLLTYVFFFFSHPGRNLQRHLWVLSLYPLYPSSHECVCSSLLSFLLLLEVGFITWHLYCNNTLTSGLLPPSVSNSIYLICSCSHKWYYCSPSWAEPVLLGWPNLIHSPSILSAQIWKPSSLEISKTSPFLGFFSAMLSFRFCSCWSQSISGELKLLSSSSAVLGSVREKTDRGHSGCHSKHLLRTLCAFCLQA